MRCVIINADDFGLSEGVNRGIEETYRAGSLSSATLMVNMPTASWDDGNYVPSRLCRRYSTSNFRNDDDEGTRVERFPQPRYPANDRCTRVRLIHYGQLGEFAAAQVVSGPVPHSVMKGDLSNNRGKTNRKLTITNRGRKKAAPVASKKARSIASSKQSRLKRKNKPGQAPPVYYSYKSRLH